MIKFNIIFNNNLIININTNIDLIIIDNIINSYINTYYIKKSLCYSVEGSLY